MLIYAQDIDVIASKDPTQAFKSMSEFTRVLWRRWHYRYCGTTVKVDLTTAAVFLQGMVASKVDNI